MKKTKFMVGLAAVALASATMSCGDLNLGKLSN